MWLCLDINIPGYPAEKKNGRYFPDDIFKCMFLTENI